MDAGLLFYYSCSHHITELWFLYGLEEYYVIIIAFKPSPYAHVPRARKSNAHSEPSVHVQQASLAGFTLT